MLAAWWAWQVCALLSIGANHCRLRHLGWEKCRQGLNSGPRGSGSEVFLNELLQLFRFPAGSAPALLAGTRPLRYCAVRFASKVPSWRLPLAGAADLVIADYCVVPAAEAGGRGGGCVGSSVPGRKRIRLNRKTPAHLAGILGIQSRPRVWKRLRVQVHPNSQQPENVVFFFKKKKIPNLINRNVMAEN